MKSGNPVAQISQRIQNLKSRSVLRSKMDQSHQSYYKNAKLSHLDEFSKTNFSILQSLHSFRTNTSRNGFRVPRSYISKTNEERRKTPIRMSHQIMIPTITRNLPKLEIRKLVSKRASKSIASLDKKQILNKDLDGLQNYDKPIDLLRESK